MTEFSKKEVLDWAARQLVADYGSNAFTDKIKELAVADAPDFVADIRAFHQKFGLAYDGPPRDLPKILSDFRRRFMEEELEEYDRDSRPPQCRETDDQRVERLADQLDALVDLVYVALGTAHLHGFNFGEAWRRVHAANMGKVRGPSDRSKEYDVVKPPGWLAPDLRDLVSP